MNTLTKVILVSAVISLPALSGNAYSDGNSVSKGGMGMDPQQMTSLRESMHNNQHMMDQISVEKNVDKRNQLMQQHIDDMHEQTQMMMKQMMEHQHQEHDQDEHDS